MKGGVWFLHTFYTVFTNFHDTLWIHCQYERRETDMMGFGYGMMGGFGRLGGGFGWIGWIFQLVILIAVIYLVVYAIRRFTPRDRYHSHSSNDALQILAERFARGEISAEEYKRMKDQLK